MKRILSILLVLTVLLGACLVPAMAEDEKILIGICQSRQDEYAVQCEKYYRSIVAEKYPNVELIFTNALGDTSRQLNDVESLILQECDVIVYRAIDADSGVACVEKIKEAGIPVMILDSAVNTDDYDVRVMADQIDHGRAIGNYINDWLNEDETREVYMGYIHGGTNENVMKREMGIYETCTSDRLHTIVTNCAFWSSDKAMSMAEDWLLTYPEINCIACASDEMAIGVIQALEGAGVDMDNFLVFGVDGTTAGQEYIRSGELDATSYQNVQTVIEKVLEVAVGLANGETFEKEINPHALYVMTAENIDELVGAAN